MQWCRISSGDTMNKNTIRVRTPIDGRNAMKPTISSAETQQTADCPEPHIALMAITLFA